MRQSVYACARVGARVSMAERIYSQLQIRRPWRQRGNTLRETLCVRHSSVDLVRSVQGPAHQVHQKLTEIEGLRLRT